MVAAATAAVVDGAVLADQVAAAVLVVHLVIMALVAVAVNLV